MSIWSSKDKKTMYSYGCIVRQKTIVTMCFNGDIVEQRQFNHVLLWRYCRPKTIVTIYSSGDIVGQKTIVTMCSNGDIVGQDNSNNVLLQILSGKDNRIHVFLWRYCQATSGKRVPFGLKKSRFSGPAPSNGPCNGFVRIKILTSHSK